jgi:hypothetical protein
VNTIAMLPSNAQCAGAAIPNRLHEKRRERKFAHRRVASPPVSSTPSTVSSRMFKLTIIPNSYAARAVDDRFVHLDAPTRRNAALRTAFESPKRRPRGIM